VASFWRARGTPSSEADGFTASADGCAGAVDAVDDTSRAPASLQPDSARTIVVIITGAWTRNGRGVRIGTTVSISRDNAPIVAATVLEPSSADP